jgi:hypothetical protein
MLTMRQLLGGMHPYFRHIPRDRMVGIANVYLKTHSVRMAGIHARSLWNKHNLAAIGNSDPAAIRLLPPAQSDHLVVGRPGQEGVIGGVPDN